MARVAGIGPVIAGWVDKKPVYYVDLVSVDGTVERMTVEKQSPGADRRAKVEAIRQRMNLANQLRQEGVVLAHDTYSFTALVALLRSRSQGLLAA